jgi:hypothetical protein
MTDKERAVAYMTKRFEAGGRKYGPMPIGCSPSTPEEGTHWGFTPEDVEDFGRILRELEEAKELAHGNAQAVDVVLASEQGYRDLCRRVAAVIPNLYDGPLEDYELYQELCAAGEEPCKDDNS